MIQLNIGLCSKTNREGLHAWHAGTKSPYPSHIPFMKYADFDMPQWRKRYYPVLCSGYEQLNGPYLGFIAAYRSSHFPTLSTGTASSGADARSTRTCVSLCKVNSGNKQLTVSSHHRGEYLPFCISHHWQQPSIIKNGALPQGPVAGVHSRQQEPGEYNRIRRNLEDASAMARIQSVHLRQEPRGYFHISENHDGLISALSFRLSYREDWVRLFDFALHSLSCAFISSGPSCYYQCSFEEVDISELRNLSKILRRAKEDVKPTKLPWGKGGKKPRVYLI